MSDLDFISFILATLRLTTPLMWGALSALLCERSGIVNLGVEGLLLMGAFFGAALAHVSGSPLAGLAAGAMGGAAAMLLYGYLVQNLKANQVVAGMGLNLLALGLTPFLSQLWFGSPLGTPQLPADARFTWLPTFLCWGLWLMVWWMFHQSRLGLRWRFAGEEPGALTASGVSVKRLRWLALSLAGICGGIGGASLSLQLSSSFVRDMAAGRGYLAIAAVILGRWRPLPTAVAVLGFGSLEAIQIRIQGQTFDLPSTIVQILPYGVTLVVLLLVRTTRMRAPAALGKS